MIYKLSYMRFVNCGIVEKTKTFQRDSDKEAVKVVRRLAKTKNDGFLPTIGKLEKKRIGKWIPVRLPKSLTSS